MKPEGNLDSVARFLDVSPRRLQQLAKEGIIPSPQSGNYDLAGCTHAYLKFLHSKQPADDPDFRVHRGRLIKARADRAELELDEIRRSIISVDELDRALEFVGASIRSRLTALPRKLAVRLCPEDPKHAEATIEAEVDSILEELAGDESLPEWLAESRRGSARANAPRIAASSKSIRQRLGR